MADTPRLGIPLLTEAQDSPDVPVNRGRQIQDALIMPVVISRSFDEPPVDVYEGDQYIVASPASGAWAGHDDDIASFQGGGWQYYTPGLGWEAFVQDEHRKVRYDDEESPAGWTQIQEGADDVSGSPADHLFRVSRGATWIGAPIDAGEANDAVIHIPDRCTIRSVTVLTQGGPGDCVIDIWKEPYAGYPPTVGNSITAAAKPTITGGIKYQDVNLTGWDTTIDAGDVLQFHLDSSVTFTFIHVSLELEPHT